MRVCLTGYGFMVFNATFNNISIILWRSVLLVEETGVLRVNHWLAASHWQTLLHNVVHLAMSRIWTDNTNGDRHQLHIGSCKSNYHTITTIWRPLRVCLTSYILDQDSHFKQNNFGLCILRCIIVEKETCHKLYKANDFRWYMWPASMYIPGWTHWQIYQESILMQLNIFENSFEIQSNYQK